MKQGLLQVILYTLFPVGTTLLGGIIATFRVPGPRLGSVLQHFATGTVFAAVAIELLPDVISKHAPKNIGHHFYVLPGFSHLTDD
jgi:ZIP family zinc transporter